METGEREALRQDVERDLRGRAQRINLRYPAVRDGEFYSVQFTQIIGTKIVVGSAWASTLLRRFHTIMSTNSLEREMTNGPWLGRVGTEMLNENLEGMPPGEERILAVRKAQNEHEAFAYALIDDLFKTANLGDQLIEVGREGGEITYTIKG